MSIKLVLATQSPYKRQLLARLARGFAADPSGIDESALKGEAPREQAQRLAESKAREVAPRHPGAWVIGADQLAEFGRERVERYLELDQPYDCTAAFRAEGAAPLLLNALESTDPTAIIGLPLLWLASVLPLHSQ